jgi:hypothetical protein
MKLHRLKRIVEKDPESRNYKDPAITPVVHKNSSFPVLIGDAVFVPKTPVATKTDKWQLP